MTIQGVYNIVVILIGVVIFISVFVSISYISDNRALLENNEKKLNEILEVLHRVPKKENHNPFGLREPEG